MNNARTGAANRTTAVFFAKMVFIAFLSVLLVFSSQASGTARASTSTNQSIVDSTQKAVKQISSGVKSGAVYDCLGKVEKDLQTSCSTAKERDQLLSEVITKLENEGSMPALIKAYLEGKFGVFDSKKQDGFITPAELARVKSSSSTQTALIKYIRKHSRAIARCVNDERNFEDCISKADLNAYAKSMAQNVKNFPNSAGTHSFNMTVEGRVRSLKAHIPASYDGKSPTPVVIVLHGAFENADYMVDRTAFSDKANSEGFIAIYPEAEYCAANRGRTWNVGDSVFWTVDDVEFVRTIILSVHQKLNIDPQRVYVVGFSNGGMMAHEIATRIPEKIAAFACVSGSMNGSESKPGEPVSALIIHGSEDKIVPMKGRRCWTGFWFFTMKPTSYSTKFWKEANEAKKLVESTSKNGVNKTVHQSTNGNSSVVQYTVTGGTHEWNNGKLDLTELIWKFFKANKKQ